MIVDDVKCIEERENIMQFFRNDDCLETLSDCDRFEIILSCASCNDELYESLREQLDRFEKIDSK
jgi:hypothetical protein